MNQQTILITGGARSGKSRFAQELASKSGKTVLFVATAEAGDEEMRQRIEKHKQSRPASWKTLEATTNIGTAISKNAGKSQVVIVDCITLLVSNVLGRCVNENIDTSLVERAVTGEINELLDCIKQNDATFILVTNEVGLGLVPDNEMGRVYRDVLGRANQLLAKQADEVYLMVAGIPVRVKPEH